MAVKLKLPPLKLSQLKALAVQCGISSAGTKPVLASRLIDEINHDGTKGKKRVLSIDMGIRNLAYCVLEQSPTASKLPSILAWKRMAVSTKPVSSVDSLTPAVKETFEPADFAAHAYKLLRHSLLLFNPTHVLIERQRFRSMGSSQILEWTLRTNMFESMLYAVLYTLSEEKIWTGEVKAIAPSKVGPYWVGTGIEKEDEQLKKTRNAKSARARNKGEKIDLVQTWLSKEEMVVLGNEEVKETARLYIEKWHRRGGRRKKSATSDDSKENDLVKLDDLADSLLQGRAWLEWEQKKRSILKDGVDVDSLE